MAKPRHNTAHLHSGMATRFPQSLFQPICPVLITTCPRTQGTISLTVRPCHLSCRLLSPGSLHKLWPMPLH